MKTPSATTATTSISTTGRNPTPLIDASSQSNNSSNPKFVVITLDVLELLLKQQRVAFATLLDEKLEPVHEELRLLHLGTRLVVQDVAHVTNHAELVTATVGQLMEEVLKISEFLEDQEEDVLDELSSSSDRGFPSIHPVCVNNKMSDHSSPTDTNTDEDGCCSDAAHTMELYELL